MSFKQYSEKFKKLIDQANSISICAHINPDGDAVGSSIGLYYALKKIGKEVYLIKNDEYPKNLEFMPQSDVYYDGKAKETDLFIVVDVASEDRIGSAKAFKDLAKKSLGIDHHATNTMYCDENIVISKASSTCEIVARLLFEACFEIDSLIATYLYLGITTDTNRYMYESTDSETLRTGAKLLDLGADKNLINLNIYDKLNPDYILLQAETIEKAKFLKDGKIIIGLLSKDMLDKYDLDFDLVEDLVSILKSIEGVEVSCLIKEHEDKEQRLSFRSKEFVDVSKIAVEFGGGGHVRASGATVNKSLEETVEAVTKRLGELNERDLTGK